MTITMTSPRGLTSGGGTPPTSAAASDSPAFEALRRIVRDRSAIALDASKNYLLETRLTPLLRRYGLASLADLVTALAQPAARVLLQDVLDAMTTNETSFFRDRHPFDALRTDILPELIRRRRAERSLTIWSNACSSGQEPYTIAILLREHFPELRSWTIRLIGSDLSRHILDRAREGLFTQTEIGRGLPSPLVVRYFRKEGVSWRIAEEIRSMVEFREVNLIEPWPATLPPMDVIFLRNVLIYFSPETKSEILRRVERVLRPDGALFLGAAETTMGLTTSLVRHPVGSATCYRHPI